MAQQLILMAYDIQQDNIRNAALRLLRQAALSYQDSVFELQLTPAELTQLQQTLERLLSANDSLLILTLYSAACWQLGTGLQSLQGHIMVIC